MAGRACHRPEHTAGPGQTRVPVPVSQPGLGPPAVTRAYQIKPPQPDGSKPGFAQQADGVMAAPTESASLRQRAKGPAAAARERVGPRPPIKLAA